MHNEYTQAVTDWLCDWASQDLAYVWEDLDTAQLQGTREYWSAKFAKIAEEFILSSRFALVRILHKRMNGNREHPLFPLLERMSGETSPAQLRNLTDEENRMCLDCLTEMARRQEDSSPWEYEDLILRAWNHRITGDPREVLSREDALHLGHVLGLTLEEMSWFLLRVLDCEDGFRFNKSHDIIEAYGFLTGCSWTHTRQLEEEYQRRCGTIPKDWSDRWEDADSVTQSVLDTLPGLVMVWSENSADTDTQFLSWMEKHAAKLDAHSASARRVYRKLAVLAFQYAREADYLPDYRDASRMIHQALYRNTQTDAVEQTLYRNGILSVSQCRTVAGALLKGNREFSEIAPQKNPGSKDFIGQTILQSASLQKLVQEDGQVSKRVGKELSAHWAAQNEQDPSSHQPPITGTDRAKFWRIPTLRNTNDFSFDSGLVNQERDRIQRLLTGEDQVEKGDLLYLVWFLFNLCREGTDRDTWTVTEQIDLFCNLCQDALEAALLPEFYPPHLTERMMLMSIIYGNKTQIHPASIYLSILSSLKSTKNKPVGAKKRSKEQWLSLVEAYQADTEHTLVEFCELHNISDKSLSKYKKQFIQEGLIPDIRKRR